MTATLHKISAGDGYEYYTRYVAAHDSNERGRDSLSDYYTARGEAPGRWVGAGLESLPVVTYRGEVVSSKINAGDEVTELQMESLLGLGLHPQANQIENAVIGIEIPLGAKKKDADRAAKTAAQLGAPFRVYDDATEFRVRCARAFNEHNIAAGRKARDSIPDEDRAQIRTDVAGAMFREEFGREPLDERELSGFVAKGSRNVTTAVAGFDWTFSPVKSFSTLWAIAPRDLAEKLWNAHLRAVEDAVAYIEEHAAFTRVGRNGVFQADVEGLLGAQFDHRESRAGDPDPHSHVVIANKVRTVDGRWLAIDARMFYRVAVTASEVYNTSLELYCGEESAVFAEREGAVRGKRPVREIVGVPTELNEMWSRRDAAVTTRLGELSVEFQHRFHREPTARETYKLVQRAVLETRQRKHPFRSLAEQRQGWHAEAIGLLGKRAFDGVVARVRSVVPPMRPVVDDKWIAAAADRVLATVSAQRSTWQLHHVWAEVEREVRGVVTRATRTDITDAVVAAALEPTRCLALGNPDIAGLPQLAVTPAVFQRRSGASGFTVADSQYYTSVKALNAEAEMVAMATMAGGRVVDSAVVEAAIARFDADPANEGRTLKQGQVDTIRAFATSGAWVQMVNAPAGTGKTTTMRVLTQAWLDSGGTVLGLAPTARATKVLEDDIHTVTATVAKLLDVLDKHTPNRERIALGLKPPLSLPQWVLDINADTLVIVDEHVQMSDHDRLALLRFLNARGATVRLIGDDMQLSAIDAGGVVGDMIAAAGDLTQSLTHVVRFDSDAEAAASLLLREGDPTGLGFHLDNQRVKVGSPASVIDDVFAAWWDDYSAGQDAVMLAATHRTVNELNALARAHRLTSQPGTATGLHVILADELHASVGDLVRTGLNNPKLKVGRNDYVRNGYQWSVDTVHDDGSLTVTHMMSRRRKGHTVHLPADYVSESVRLGYASTINSVQGMTADTCHTVLTGAETRAQLYVAITRGRQRNMLYVVTGLDGSEGSFWTEQALLPRTAVELLIRVLGNETSQTSAHSRLEQRMEPSKRLSHAADSYFTAVHIATAAVAGADTSLRLDQHAQQLLPGLTGYPAYPVLRQHLLTLSLNGTDPIAALRAAIGARSLVDVGDVAAVLDWRLDTSGAHSAQTGPLPWLPAIPAAVAADPDTGPYLLSRAQLVSDLATQVRDTAAAMRPATAPMWARPLAGADMALLADVAVWRASNNISGSDPRPCGPIRQMRSEVRYHELLNARIKEAIGDVNRAVNKWAVVAKEVEPRILDDPFWPMLADKLDTAHRAGIDVAALLSRCAAIRPLPDELPAAALWSRLALDPGATAGGLRSGARLHPVWEPDLREVFGSNIADVLTDDPAWAKVVAAVDTATRTLRNTDGSMWTAREVLDVAHDLLDTGRDSDDVLRSDQLALGFAWRIDALIDSHRDNDLFSGPPTEPDFDDEAPPVPDTEYPRFDDPAVPPESEHPMPEPAAATVTPPDAGPTEPSHTPGPATTAQRLLALNQTSGLTDRARNAALARIAAAATDVERDLIRNALSINDRNPELLATHLERSARLAQDPVESELAQALLHLLGSRLVSTKTADEIDAYSAEARIRRRRVDEVIEELEQRSRTHPDRFERQTLEGVVTVLRGTTHDAAINKLRGFATKYPERGKTILGCLTAVEIAYQQQTVVEVLKPRSRWTTPNDRLPVKQSARRFSEVETRVDTNRRRQGTPSTKPSDPADEYFKGKEDIHVQGTNPDSRDKYAETMGNPDPVTGLVTKLTDTGPRQRGDWSPGRDKQPDREPSPEEQAARFRGRADLCCLGCEEARNGRAQQQRIQEAGFDDALCRDCRTDGAIGLTEHEPVNHIRARSEFIAARYPPAEALARFRRDFKTLHPKDQGRRMITWVTEKRKLVERAAAVALQQGPQRLMTDQQLAVQITELSHRFQLEDEQNAVLTGETDLPGAVASPAGELTPVQLIHAALAADEEVAALRTQIRVLEEEAKDTRKALHAATDTREKVEARDNLKQINGDKRRLSTDRDRATENATALAARATDIAGPVHSWDTIISEATTTYPPTSTTASADFPTRLVLDALNDQASASAIQRRVDDVQQQISALNKQLKSADDLEQVAALKEQKRPLWEQRKIGQQQLATAAEAVGASRARAVAAGCSPHTWSEIVDQHRRSEVRDQQLAPDEKGTAIVEADLQVLVAEQRRREQLALPVRAAEDRLRVTTNQQANASATPDPLAPSQHQTAQPAGPSQEPAPGV